jgi:hypothetical protein
MQVCKNTNIHVSRIHAHVFQKFGAFNTASLLTFVMITRCPFLIGETGIDHYLILTRVQVEADGRVPYLFTCAALPENVGSQVGLEPTRVDWVNAGLLY